MPYYGLEPETLSNTTQSLPVPVGSVMAFLSTTMPTGFIICDGRTIQNTAPLDPDYYPQLVEVLNPGGSTAVVPDLRGQFLRGHSIDNSVDPDGPRAPGNSQADAFEDHVHDVFWSLISHMGGSEIYENNPNTSGSSYLSGGSPTGDLETRPKNISVVWGIKASDTVINSTIYSEVDPSSLFRQVVNSQKDQFNGRLSISNSDPFATGTGTTLYLLPYNGNSIWLYNISKAIWERYSIPVTPPSLVLTGLTAFLPYDVFVYSFGGNLTLEHVAWTNATTRATTLITQDGVYVKNGEVNKRFVGTFFPINSTTIQIDRGIIDISYNGGYYNNINYSCLMNHYNKIKSTISLVSFDPNTYTQNTQIIFPTTTGLLAYNATHPNISKFEYVSTLLNDVEITATTSISHAELNSPGTVHSTGLNLVTDYTWVISDGYTNLIANSRQYAVSGVVNAHKASGNYIPEKGYNQLATVGIQSTVDAYAWESLQFQLETFF